MPTLETIKEQRKRYYAEKVKCICGVTICRGSLANHDWSLKHLNYLSNHDVEKENL